MNELELTNKICELFDIYGNLLTSKQQDVIVKYYFYNLSLFEISEDSNISRNAVLDSLEHAKNKLFEYENKLHILEKIKKISNIEFLSEEEKNIIVNIFKD